MTVTQGTTWHPVAVHVTVCHWCQFNVTRCSMALCNVAKHCLTFEIPQHMTWHNMTQMGHNILHGTMWHLWEGLKMWHDMMQHCMAWYNTAKYVTTWHDKTWQEKIRHKGTCITHWRNWHHSINFHTGCSTQFHSWTQTHIYVIVRDAKNQQDPTDLSQAKTL